MSALGQKQTLLWTVLLTSSIRQLRRCRQALTHKASKLQTEDPAKAKAMLAEFMSDESVVAGLAKPVEFGVVQLAFVKDTLAKHPDVHWTFVFLH
jgi:hypothetical protein